MPEIPNPEMEAAGAEAAKEVIEDAAKEAVVEGELTLIEAALAASVGVPELLSLVFGNANPLRGFLQSTDKNIGAAIVDPLLFDMMGIDRPPAGDEAYQAIDTIRRVAGFAFTLPAAAAALNFLGKQRFGKHWPETVSEQLKSIPEELGFGFFLGGLLEKIYDQAVGKSIEEMINRQVHPNRMDPGTLRALARQRKLTEEEYRKYLDDLGYRDEDKEVLLKLDQQLLTVGDIQTAYLEGLLNEDQVRTYLQGLGYTDSDVELLLAVYLQKGVTEGASIYKSVARAAFADGQISEQQFRTMLGNINVPQASIDLEVAAVNLQTTLKHATISIGTLKSGYQDGSLSKDVVTQHLLQEHYSNDDITALFEIWDSERKKTSPGLDVTRILSYELGGFFDADVAYGKLLGLGMNPNDARFLADHPSSQPATFKYPLTPPEVSSALQEQVITVEEAQHLLSDLNMDQEAQTLTILTAVARQKRPKPPKQPKKELSEADLKSAVAYGLMTIGTATDALTTMGYSPTDAHIKMAIWVADLTGHSPTGFTAI